jgi:hypothetical protein
MTVTYTLLKKGIEGNSRVNYGFVTYASGDSVAYMQTGLRMLDGFDVASLNSGSVIATYPLAYPAKVDQSGYVTVVLHSHASGAVLWRAVGKI